LAAAGSPVISVQGRPVGQTKAELAPPPHYPSLMPAQTLTLPLDSETTAPKGFDDGQAGLIIGDFVAVPEPARKSSQWFGTGDWFVLPDGRQVATIAFFSPEAVGIRVGLSELALPPGAYLTAFATLAGQPVFGPYTGLERPGTELWLPTCFGDTAVLQVVVPPLGDTTAVTVAVNRICHIHTDPSAIISDEKGAGSCNVDATCHPEWAGVANAVAGLGVISQYGAIFCTGTLIAPPNLCSVAYYMLTANHCVRGDGGLRGADALEFYWHYATDTCNGTPPSLSAVPRTVGGADYLSGDSGRPGFGKGTDFTLMALRNAPPASAMQAGWTNAPPADSKSVATIHHPRGDYRRISFGYFSTLLNPFSDDYHMVIWSDGTTELASSGAALFRTDTQQVIGQLWGGASSCSLSIAPDFFGRLDVSYPTMAHHFESPSTVSVAAGDLMLEPEPGVHLIRLILPKPARPGGVDIAYSLVGKTAQEGVDFAGAAGVVHIPGGATEGTLPIALLDTPLPYDDRRIAVHLSDPDCGVIDLPEGEDEIVVEIAPDMTDSDGDGIRDIDELTGRFGYFTDPHNPDTDGDGLTDYEEIFGVWGYFTDPTNPDTDGDGIDDFTEILLGLNPLVDEGIGLSSLAVPWFTEEAK